MVENLTSIIKMFENDVNGHDFYSRLFVLTYHILCEYIYVNDIIIYNTCFKDLKGVKIIARYC